MTFGSGAKMPCRDDKDEIAKMFGLMTVEGNSLGIGNCITTDSLRKVICQNAKK
jgi:hypothetical protein